MDHYAAALDLKALDAAAGKERKARVPRHAAILALSGLTAACICCGTMRLHL